MTPIEQGTFYQPTANLFTKYCNFLILWEASIHVTQSTKSKYNGMFPQLMHKRGLFLFKKKVLAIQRLSNAPWDSA